MHADIVFGTESERLRRDLREAVQHDLSDFMHRPQLIRLITRRNFQAVSAPAYTRALR
jgi:hypothetical protein